MNEERRYTIAEATARTGLSGDTIRYYEKIGLLPAPGRKANGHRYYDDQSIATMKLLLCLKKTGMSLEEMKPFLGLSLDGDFNDYPELFDKILNHRAKIQQQMDDLGQVLAFIDEKIRNASMANTGCEGN